MKLWASRALACLLVATFAVTAWGQEVVITPRAKELFEHGVRLLEDAEGSRYEEAYTAFRAAYAESPSPKILGNIGFCAMKLERDGEAIDAYRQYLAEVKEIAPTERAYIAESLKTLQTGLVRVTLVVKGTPAKVIDERSVVKGDPVSNRYDATTDAPLELGIRAGTHTFRFTAEGYETVTWELQAEPGTSHRHEVTLELATDDGDDLPIPTSAWVVGGVTLAVGVGAGVAGILALTTFSDYEEAEAAGDIPKATDLKDRGEALNIAADVLLGVAVAGAVATIILVFVDQDPPEHARVQPWVSPQGGGLAIGGRF